MKGAGRVKLPRTVKMTGMQFESQFCEFLKEFGYWALNIPKNKYGAQPFDVVAIHGNEIFAVDCKVCSTDLFQLERVEDNQWLAFQMVNERTNAKTGIMAYYKGDVYYLPYVVLCAYVRDGLKSIKLTKLKPYWSKDDIKDVMGRYLE